MPTFQFQGKISEDIQKYNRPQLRACGQKWTLKLVAASQMPAIMTNERALLLTEGIRIATALLTSAIEDTAYGYRTVKA